MIEQLQRELQQKNEDAQLIGQESKSLEANLKEQLASAVNKKEQLETDLKAATRQMKDKERKFGNLENKLKDMEDEQLIALEQHQETLKSKQMIWQHTLDEQKRRCMEVEDQLKQSRNLCEELRVQAEAPTQDKKGGGPGGANNESEEVLQLHEQLTEMHNQLTMMENQNMESVALLKQENRKLTKQLKEAQAAGGAGGD